NSIHGNARIKQINTSKIKEHLAEGKIVVVAGFQGIDENLNITTLGRGGSDTTAVAIAASIKADCCQIYTDVDGIYSSDPRIVRSVSKINTISYDEMLELSSLGAKVLHNRCVEIGSKYNVPIYVKSTFEKDSIGTLLTTKNLIEDLCINGVTKQDDIVRITLIGKDEKIGRIYKVFNLLAANDINVDIIVQAFGEHITKDISFAIKQEDLELTLEILNENADDLNINDIKYCKNLSKVSLVGIGILNNPKVIAALFEILYENNINMHMITTSETKISILVNQNLGETTLKLIHDKFIQPSI
ncbi:MAG: aspartate kinase, partial [Clostridia bacterium]|nr:aspartate kinase [Clostridia bacterium]